MYYITGTLTNVVTSVDLQHWQPYTFVAYVSSQGIETIVSDGMGIPVNTNYSTASMVDGVFTSTNSFYFGVWVNNYPAIFTRFLP
jgi:hypothetical protein